MCTNDNRYIIGDNYSLWIEYSTTRKGTSYRNVYNGVLGTPGVELSNTGILAASA